MTQDSGRGCTRLENPDPAPSPAAENSGHGLFLPAAQDRFLGLDGGD